MTIKNIGGKYNKMIVDIEKSGSSKVFTLNNGESHTVKIRRLSLSPKDKERFTNSKYSTEFFVDDKRVDCVKNAIINEIVNRY